MDLVQMAGHLSVEFGAVMEGPFGDESYKRVTMWLPNKRGIALAWVDGRDVPGTAEMAVIRETVPVRGHSYDGTPWRFDYSTEITNDVEPGTDLDGAREALRVLRSLPAIDPRDQRSTRRDDARQWSAAHYGASRPACGARIREDDTCTEVIKDVRCLDCLEAVNRAV